MLPYGTDDVPDLRGRLSLRILPPLVVIGLVGLACAVSSALEAKLSSSQVAATSPFPSGLVPDPLKYRQRVPSHDVEDKVFRAIKRKVKESQASACRDISDLWRDTSNNTCTKYVQNGWCIGGHSGPSWKFQFGDIRNYQASRVCCACGGGIPTDRRVLICRVTDLSNGASVVNAELEISRTVWPGLLTAGASLSTNFDEPHVSRVTNASIISERHSRSIICTPACRITCRWSDLSKMQHANMQYATGDMRHATCNMDMPQHTLLQCA